MFPTDAPPDEYTYKPDDPERIHKKHIIGGDAFIVTNHLFGEALYSWWLIEVSRYEDGEISGTLMDDIRAGINGPFVSQADAELAMRVITDPSDKT
jgi:hypothetical protein